MEYILRFEFIEFGLEYVELVMRVLRDMFFVLRRFDRIYIYNFFNWIGGFIIIRDVGIED